METLHNTLTWMTNPLVALYQRLAVLLPNLFGALVLLLFGYAFARIAGAITRRVLVRFGVDGLMERSGISALSRDWGMKLSLSRVLGIFVFVFIFLAFIISALDSLGLTGAGQTVSAVMLFLPRFIAAMLVLVLGLMAAKWISTLVGRMAENSGLEYASTLSRLSFGVLAALVVLLAVEQLEIHIVLMQEVVSVALAAIGIALALSLGLGTRTLSGEIVGGVYLRDLLKTGDRIEWNGKKATVQEVGSVKTLLVLEDGRQLSVANSRLVQEELIISR
ncbi:mechanosensitive ion channel family protein [Candidatus Igneacidithiobacillus taiwanensis]|uniref:mechanosensitive ion channel family protein n=3 Tax=Candidatus Igneacidithiobacillus taiwanensis TaxID=1945924 RepID=UPI00289938C9|nr:mechanosensitive ion channel domain-containing protein [Candidatus Igneacidithiobacillus taiwanensis]